MGTYVRYREQMSRYDVTLSRSGQAVTITVEAASRDEAIRLAWEQVRREAAARDAA